MSHRHSILIVLALAALAVSAEAQGQTTAFERTRPLPVADPAPRLRIVQPAAKQVMTTRLVKGDTRLSCLLDNKDRLITVSADNWPVKPGGPGVLVVVDDIYAITVHDLSKPISMEQLEPFTDAKSGSVDASPVSGCGWHSIAVMPTTASGQMVAVPPVVTWFLNKPTNANDMPRMQLADYLKSPLVVINWPLLGSYFPGDGDSGRPGWKLARTDKVPLDFTIGQVPRCGLVMKLRDDETDAVLSPGLAYMTHLPSDPELELDWIEKCPEGITEASAGWKGVTLYAKPPAKVVARKWPAMSERVDAADRAAERAAHRLPGKKPYDGRFNMFTAGGMGSLTCPSPVTFKNGASDMPIALGRSLSFGSVHVTVDRDGYINPQTFKLPAPKPIKGGSPPDADEAAEIASVEVSGDFSAEETDGKRGTRLAVRIDIVGPDGSKSGHGCHAIMLIDGYARKFDTCSTTESCGTPGYPRCCTSR